MKVRSIFISVLLLATAAFAVDAPTSRAVALAPPVPQQVFEQTSSHANDTIAAIVTVAPEIPRGPAEMLQEYRAQMTLTSQTLSSELRMISVALRSGQITREQAEYLIQQRAQLAAMQYEVFNALYEALAFDVAQAAAAAAHPQCLPQSDSSLVVQVPPTLCSGTRAGSN